MLLLVLENFGENYIGKNDASILYHFVVVLEMEPTASYMIGVMD